MLWAITALTFVATFGILAAVFYAFAPGGGIASRLSRLANTGAPPVQEISFTEKQKEDLIVQLLESWYRKRQHEQ